MPSAEKCSEPNVPNYVLTDDRGRGIAVKQPDKWLVDLVRNEDA